MRPPSGEKAGHCTELRIFKARFDSGNFIVTGERYVGTLSGWFDDPNALAIEAGRLKLVSGYVTLNPVKETLLARASNQLVKAKHTTTDGDIAAIRWLYVDIDPVRPADISSTEEELAAAVARRDQILADHPDLAAAAMWGRSGNGTWILARLNDLPVDEKHTAMIGAALATLSIRYSDGVVKVDESTKNPSRVMCLPGTLKCKGSNVPKRPWRMVTVDGGLGDEDANNEGVVSPSALTTFDLATWLKKHAVQQTKGGGSRASKSASTSTGRRSSRGPTESLDVLRLRGAEAYLASFAPAISGQRGHDQTFDAACALIKGFGLTVAESRPILAAYNARCQPPWSEQDLEHKLQDADEKPDQEPRGFLWERSPLNPANRQAANNEGSGTSGRAHRMTRNRHVAPGSDGCSMGQGGAGDSIRAGNAGEVGWEWGEDGGTTVNLPPANSDGAGNTAPAGGNFPIFANYTEETVSSQDGGPPQTIKEPSIIHDLVYDLSRITPGWPKRVAESIFVQTDEFTPIYLTTSTRTFAWIDGLTQVDWAKGPRYITQERFHEHLRMTAERYDAIETLPHWPPRRGVYYMHPAIDHVETGALDEFLDFFNPASDVDRELIRALILTMFWGGDPGTRPAFLITGRDDDSERGRGLGKSTLISILAESLCGGFLEVSPTDSIGEVKTRLLSPSARELRIARLDNVKTLKFSWGDLEGMLTSPVISGRELYSGEGRRPNTLIWCMTMNGASLSKDMAQRTVAIQLERPPFDPNWTDTVLAYARTNRLRILSDIRRLLEDDRLPINARTRWGVWESQVLAQTDLFYECQQAIVARQKEYDDDDDEYREVEGHIRSKLDEAGHDPDTSCVFITSRLLATWLSDVMQKPCKATGVTSALKRLGIKELSMKRKNTKKGWLWTGKNSRKREEAELDVPLWSNGSGFGSGPSRWD